MSNPLENMMKKRGEYIEQVKKLHNLRTQENKALYGETSKKTKQFLQDTKAMRLRIQNQLENLDDNDSGNMQVLTTCLEDRIKQCDETLNNLMKLKDQILSRSAVTPDMVEALRFELLLPVEHNEPSGSCCTQRRNSFGIFDYLSKNNPLNKAFTTAANESLRSYRANDCYQPLANLAEAPDTSEDETKPRVTGFTKYPPEKPEPTKDQGDDDKPEVVGFTKFCSNVHELHSILEQCGKGREECIKKIGEFCSGKPAGPSNQMQDPPSMSRNWAYSQYKPNNNINPLCCGPSKLRPIFDSKITKLEQQIVKYCFEIKEKNILIEQCCRSKEVLLCQKHNLHNILLKLCEKIKQLEKKLHRIKLAVCCPNFPMEDCSAKITCRDEILNLQKLEEKLEILYNGAKHKECLLEICKTSIATLKEDKTEWEKDIKQMEKIRNELEQQLNNMKLKVCRKLSITKTDDEPMEKEATHRKSTRHSQPDRLNRSTIDDFPRVDENRPSKYSKRSKHSSLNVIKGLESSHHANRYMKR
ncbi:uncharacterized protein LOC119659845 [Hermetia illucens]|uniref:uncharacterized protein LOC119659845 n=1 Tax=Hermetia illucens TaxID=343691 RepID=UPI0018CC5B28|nr:uncharacterized protein LOC119659845 [Hermetia illucens]